MVPADIDEGASKLTAMRNAPTAGAVPWVNSPIFLMRFLLPFRFAEEGQNADAPFRIEDLNAEFNAEFLLQSGGAVETSRPAEHRPSHCAWERKNLELRFFQDCVFGKEQ
jgi:hypothetical protein